MSVSKITDKTHKRNKNLGSKNAPNLNDEGLTKRKNAARDPKKEVPEEKTTSSESKDT